MHKQEQLYQYHDPNHEDEKETRIHQPKTIFNMEIVHKTYDEVRGHNNNRPVSAQPFDSSRTNLFQRLSEQNGLKRSTPRRNKEQNQICDENEQLGGTVPTPNPRRATGSDFPKSFKDQKHMRPCEFDKGSARATSYQHGLRAPPCGDATPRFSTMACVTSQAAITSELRKPTQHRQTKSASKKLVEYLRNSADLLDETRRDIAGKISPHLNGSFDIHVPFSLGHRRGSVASLESFYCAGEATPCVEPVVRCRLCRRGVEGPRGLCVDCEGDYRRPSSALPSLKSDCGSSDGRPTPPPKDYKYCSAGVREEVKRPSTAGRVGGEVRVGHVESQQRIITPTPTRQHSMKVAIIDREEDNSMDMSTWATVYGSSDFEYFEKLEPVQPLKITKKGLEKPSRDTNFYSFYDELL